LITTEFLLYIAAGAFAGLLSGVFGVGGGIVLVPILSFLFMGLHFPETHLMHMVLGTSLATIILTSISSARAHRLKNNVNSTLVIKMAPSVIVGTLLGTLLASQLHSVWLKIVIAAFELCIATQLMLNLNPSPYRSLPGSIVLGLVGGLIGVASSLIGIGGGTLIVPYLIYCNLDPRQTIGTSAAIGLPIAVTGTLGYIFTGLTTQFVHPLPQPSLGFVYLPAFIGIAIASVLTAPVGAALAQRLPILVLKRLFALLLYIVSIKMIWGAL